MSSPRIYVACLASYNAGKLHGEWIEDCTDADTIRDEIAAILRKSPCPNVEVDCPECAKRPRPTQEIHEWLSRDCEECGGKGKVPSAEEWAIHDYEGFDGIELGEYPDLDNLATHARMIEEHDGAWAAYVDHVGEHYATEDGFTESYRGQYKSAEDYAEELATEAGYLKRDQRSNPLLDYIDWERYARDLEHDGYAFVDDKNGGVYVFSS